MSDKPTIYKLTEELHELNDWYSLGVALRVSPDKLQEIQKSSPHDGISRWRIDMLQFWLNSTPDASWNDIIAALKKIGHHTLSDRLSTKYPALQSGQQDCAALATTATTTHAQVTESPVIVPGIYRDDFEDIQDRFAQLFDEVSEILENEKSVTLEQLKRFVSKIPEMSYSLDNARTISDIIDVIHKHSSLTSCTHLKGVARRFKVPAAIEKIEDYYEFMKKFCQQELTHHNYMKPLFDSSYTPTTTITFELRWSPAEKTLSDIQDLLQLAFETQSLYVHIVVVRGGSVRVLCCAPQYLMSELVRLAQKNRKLLVESSVTYLRVGDTIVVDTSEQNEVALVKDLVLWLTVALQLKENQRIDSQKEVTEGKATYYQEAQETAAETKVPVSSSIWLITVDQAKILLTDKPNATFLVRENRGRPMFDPSTSSINTHIISVVVNGKIHHVAIYRKDNHYGFLNNEKYLSVEDFVTHLSRAGMRFKDNTLVQLTNQLIPDRDTLAKLPLDIPRIVPRYTFSDVASLPKHYPHHVESAWLCRLLSKEESERLLRGRVDETFLVRATDLSGPTHVYTVDIVVRSKVVSLSVHQDGDWLQFEPWTPKYDSIHTLVMHHVRVAYAIPVRDHTVLTYFRYPVHSSQ